ncbi:MAG: transcription termination/antitermination NusG family protein [Candidatus Binatia bacterium]
MEPWIESPVGTGQAWYVVQTKRHRERVAQRFLAERKVASYLPQIVEWPRPVVGSAIAPMFPGYLFVHTVVAEQFIQIMRSPGVKTFVTFGAAPVPLDDSIIDFLRGREGPDGLIRCNQGVRENSEVRIVHGPFRGLTAIVEERLPARERIRVLMELMQRATRVELPEKWVRQG